MVNKKEVSTQDDSFIDVENRVYEVGFLISSLVSDATLEKDTASIKKAITSNGGELLSSGDPKRIKLAYSIKRTIEGKSTVFTEGYFGWQKFESSARSVASMKKVIEEMENVVRFLIIKTEKEDLVKFGYESLTGEKEEVTSEEEPIVIETPKEEVAEVKEKTEEPKMSDADMDKVIDQLV